MTQSSPYSGTGNTQKTITATAATTTITSTATTTTTTKTPAGHGAASTLRLNNSQLELVENKVKIGVSCVPRPL